MAAGQPAVGLEREAEALTSETLEETFAIGARITVPLHTHTVAEALAALESERLRTSEIATRIPNLDDVYLQLTGGTVREAA